MARTPLQAEASRRSLNTARAVLRVLSYLAGCSEGAISGEVSRFLGKSSYTAYYLLNSLCQEGFAHRDRAGRYRLNAFCRDLRSRTLLSPPATLDSLHEALNDLNSVTGCRAYLVVYDGQALIVEGVRGRQGQLGVKGVGSEIRAELARVSQEGLAFDREEYEEGVYCIAVPISAVDKGQELLASLGIVVPSGPFKAQGSRLVEIVREVASHIGPPGAREEAPGGGGRRGGSEGAPTNYLPEHRLLA
jgi:DNA-binding IclR family transcriptional regulator